MSALEKLERDYLAADLAGVDRLLARLTDEDVMMRFSLEARRADLRREIEALEDAHAPTASAALFFGGKPVVGSIGIESEFGGNAIAKFQDLVAKLFAQNELGGLGQRGVIARKAATRLHITNIVRGSFGFLLEEVRPQGDMLDTTLKSAVEEASRLLSAFADDDEEHFQAEVERVDQRVLNTAKEFFDLMRNDSATFRLVVGKADRSFNADVVARASERAIGTTIEDDDEALEGNLAGVLPEGHLFEYRTETARGVIRGRVDRNLTAEQLAAFNRDWIDVPSRAVLRVRKVLINGELVREGFTLVRLVEREQL